MPSRNVIREYGAYQYYHVYNRGVAKQIIFCDAQDKRHFLAIVARHLDPDDTSTKSDGSIYRKFDQDLDLLCYCLMGNHFHLLFYTKDDGTILGQCMQSILTAYTMYFNKRYRRVGTLFQGVFKASRISSDAYLSHITRYIHLNPRTYRTYYYSSLRYYLGSPPPPWLKPYMVFDPTAYGQFLEDYEDKKELIDHIKQELADH